MILRLATCCLLVSAAAMAKSYLVDGVVVATDTGTRTMLVSHRPIGRFMPAMAMPFRVDDAAQLRALHPGMRITFHLQVGKQHSRVSDIRPTGEPDESIAAPKEQLRIGDAVPDFSLRNQKGMPTKLSDFRGRVLAVNFIYTRCPLPDVCPRLSANFAQLQKRLAAGGRNDAVLLSITVDPDYDTPAVLSDYARRWGAQENRWQFLTGDVAAAAPALGEVYWTDEGSIGHNSSTAVIGRDGRLAALLSGSGWRVEQLESLIVHELEKTK